MTALPIQHHELSLFENGGSYINYKRIYFSYFKKIPNVKQIDNINEKKYYHWLESTLTDKIQFKHISEMYDKKKQLTIVNTIHFLQNEMLLDMEDGHVIIAYQQEQEEDALEFIQQLKKMIVREKNKQEICLITTTNRGLDTIELELTKPKLDLQKQYNDDILPMHSTILSTLKLKNKSGLILFHGQPGTGKSTYIRYFIHHLKKKVLFMPPKLAGNLDTPDFTSLLIRNANSIFIIEDAEDLLVSRDQFKNSNISMLLNLTDGLLGESLGIQIIATFNTNINNIDKALLRKGRLTALYEFKPLAIEKSKILLQEIGNTNTNVQAPMTLADIYNAEPNNFVEAKPQRTIGFASGVN